MRSVALRTKEIGIRVSLGAQRNQIVTAIAKKTLVEIGAGLLAGAAMTTILVKIIHRLLVEPQPSAVWVYAISSGVILLVAGAAMYFPAKRAVSVDPVCALRTE
jgi:ABC-type antimicrobial peptide transport system permease subunit